MKKTLIISFLLGFILTGCSTKSGLSPTVSHSGFDNSQVVNIVPHATAFNSASGLNETRIGAEWNAANGKAAILTIEIVDIENEYHAITGVKFNIDGEIVTLTPVSGSVTDFFKDDAAPSIKTSSRGYVTTIDVIEKIIHSHKTWLRVSTPTGYVENAVIDGDKDSKAYNALIRFMNAVKANSNSSL